MEELLGLVQLRGQDKDEGDDRLALAGRCLLPPGSLSVSPLFPGFSLSSPSSSVRAARKRRRRCGRVVPPTPLPLLCFSFPSVSPQSFSSSPGNEISPPKSCQMMKKQDEQEGRAENEEKTFHFLLKTTDREIPNPGPLVFCDVN
ncbi:hypothetical protein Peur_013392 [Populus x canadensis]